MLKSKDLVKALRDIEVGEGFNIEFKDECSELIIGVRCRDIMDTTCIFVGGYSMGILTFNLNESEDYELIVDQIMKSFSAEKLLKFVKNNE